MAVQFKSSGQISFFPFLFFLEIKDGEELLGFTHWEFIDASNTDSEETTTTAATLNKRIKTGLLVADLIPAHLSVAAGVRRPDGHEGEGYEVYADCEQKGSLAEDPEKILPILIT